MLLGDSHRLFDHRVDLAHRRDQLTGVLPGHVLSDGTSGHEPLQLSDGFLSVAAETAIVSPQRQVIE